MKKPSVSPISVKMFKASLFITVGIFVLLIACAVIAQIYQMTSGGSLTDVTRNVGLPEGAITDDFELSPVSTLKYQDIQSKYAEMDDDQWKDYALSILGSRVDWSGKVYDMDSRRVEIDMGTTPLRYLVLVGMSGYEKAHMSIGDPIEFEGRLIGFYSGKGMNPAIDNVQIK